MKRRKKRLGSQRLAAAIVFFVSFGSGLGVWMSIAKTCKDGKIGKAVGYYPGAIVGLLVGVLINRLLTPQLKKMSEWRYIRSFESIASRRPVVGRV